MSLIMPLRVIMNIVRHQVIDVESVNWSKGQIRKCAKHSPLSLAFGLI